MCKTMIGSFTGLLAAGFLAVPANAAVLMDAGFETSDFSPGITGFKGDADTTAGRWGKFNTNSGAFITDQVSVSGDQAIQVERGGNKPVGRVDASVTEDDFEISYWVRRQDAGSSVIVQAGDGDVQAQSQLSIFIDSAGDVNVRNSTDTGRMSSGFNIGEDEWVRLRQDVVVGGSNVSYDLFQTTGVGGTEQLVGSYTVPDAPTNIDRIYINPQGADGTLTAFDDLTISQVVPEPASLGLMLVGGATMLARRRHARG